MSDELEEDILQDLNILLEEVREIKNSEKRVRAIKLLEDCRAILLSLEKSEHK